MERNEASWRNSSMEENCEILEETIHQSVVSGLVVVNNIGMIFCVIFLVVTIVYICAVEKLRTKFLFLQLQVCITLALSELCFLLGFWLSPCQILAINEEKFESLCTYLSAIHLFANMSTFSWMGLVALHVCRLVAQECQEELMRQQNDKTGRRLTLDERALKDRVSSISREGLHRKISRDLLELWKQNVKPLYDKEMKEIEKVEEKTIKSMWYVKTFASSAIPLWCMFLIGYLPPLTLAVLAILTQPNVVFTPFNGWSEVEGLDTFCWPGTESKMIWYLVFYIPFLVMGTYYFRYKATQMVRILRGGPIASVKTLSKWERRRMGLENPPEIEQIYMEPTAIQLMVVTFTCVLGVLQTLYIWGLMLPYAVLSFFKGFVFCLHHVLRKSITLRKFSRNLFVLEN